MRGEITGWFELQANLDSLIHYFQQDADSITHDELLATANDIAEAMRVFAPFDTGLLRSSIQVVDMGGEQGIEIQSNAHYSMFVEFGTVKMAAKPFMRPAFEQYGVFVRVANRHAREIGSILTTP